MELARTNEKYFDDTITFEDFLNIFTLFSLKEDTDLRKKHLEKSLTYQILLKHLER